MKATLSPDAGFSLKLTRECFKPGTNMCLSPYSVRIAFSMALNGASGSTLRQMATVLGYSDVNVSAVNKQNEQSLRAMTAGLPQGMLQIANSLWMSIHEKLNPTYVKRVTAAYRSDVFPQDFRQSNAVTKVNKWVDQKTKGRIKKLFEKLDADTILVLVNAITFDGKWIKQFDPKQTRSAPWLMRNKMLYKVPYMSQTNDFAYNITGEYSAVQLDYDTKGWSMLLIMPEVDIPLNKFLSELTVRKLTDIISQLSSSDVSLSMPKFDLASEHKLIPILKSMGMTQPFGGEADFRAMSGTGSRNLYISEALQKATITVDEKGTKAAAATGIGMMKMSMPRQLLFNRPFIYMIRNEATGELLFTGVLEKP